MSGAAQAAEPELGPTGWTWFGPLPPGRDATRDEVVLDPADCRIEVRRTDLDGGPGNRDVRLARVWTGRRWEWADDWRLDGSRLSRPGRGDVRVDADARWGEERLVADAAGRVVERLRGRDRLQILRDEQGEFVGMQRGEVGVRVDGQGSLRRGVAVDGREVRFRYDQGELRSVLDSGGSPVIYTWRDGILAGIVWADGGSVALSGQPGRSRVTGAGGPWSCSVSGDIAGARTTLVGPAGTWIVSRASGSRVVTDPIGGTTRSYWQDGRLTGWTDPRPGDTRIVRDPEGRITAVTDPSGARWSFEWTALGVASVGAPDGTRWALSRGATGGIERVDDPAGRSVTWEVDPAGRQRGWRIGASRWGYVRDAAGRVVAVTDPVGSDVTLRRDRAGRVVTVRDGAGSEWNVDYDGWGRTVAVRAPGGARWDLRRDPLGRVISIRDPVRETRWSWRPDGTIGRVVVGASGVWELLWNAAGHLSALRDPEGRLTGWSRDALGRPQIVHRADGSALALGRDAAGDLRSAGGVNVRRDASGRALGLSGAAGTVAWDRDPSGRVIRVTAPGTILTIARESAGSIREVRVGETTPVRLQRDGQGRVVRAEADAAIGAVVDLTRDAAGRILSLTRSGAPAVRIDRDVRGLESSVSVGSTTFAVGRDATGRTVSLEASGGVRLGVDRDGAGRPRHVRFSDGALARFTQDEHGTTISIEDRDGARAGEGGWEFDATGLLSSLRSGATWLLRRDPLGALVAVESEAAVWSSTPDGVDGPGGAFVRYDARGRPISARSPSGARGATGSTDGAWGLGAGPAMYDTDDDGAMRAVLGDRGKIRLHHDAAGRLDAWEGPAGKVRLARDAFGRLARVGGTPVDGWDGLVVLGGAPFVHLARVAVAARDFGAALDPRGTPAFLVRPRGLAVSPAGGPAATGEAAGSESHARNPSFAAAGGRFQPIPDGPLLSLSDAVDPLSGQATGPVLRLPWAPRPWEPAPGASPLASPDAAASAVPWDPAGWAPDSPWSDPLALLIAVGELPSGAHAGHAPSAAGSLRTSRVPGLPWLPSSLAPELPAVLPDPSTFQPDDDPVIAWVYASARAPTEPPEPASLATALLSPGLHRALRSIPDLALPLPAELGGGAP